MPRARPFGSGLPQPALSAASFSTLLKRGCFSSNDRRYWYGSLPAAAAMKAFKADGITIQQFNEGAGGQVVFHLHMHVIPRKAGVAMKPPASEKEKPDVLSDQALKLAAGLKG